MESIQGALRGVAFDRHIGLSDTVVVAGIGRSGSTLVSEVINCDNIYRVLFEPFRYDLVREAQNFVYPFYLRPDHSDSQLLQSARNILSGKVRSPWSDKKNRCVFPKKRLIKDIRVNMFLKWLHGHFPEIRIILLVRHPCAVAESWLSTFGRGSGAYERLRANEHFVQDIGTTIMDRYEKAESQFENLFFLWCISYWVPLHQFNKDEVCLLFYEDLLLNPDAELDRMFSFLGQPYSLQKARSVISKPSSTARANRAPDFKGFSYNGWRARMTATQVEQAFEIMSLFGLEKLYSPVTDKPDKEAALSLFGSM
jgi:hypothetical protein